ncbi:hypothetical protein EE612_037047, partial [Oryza sativa]
PRIGIDASRRLASRALGVVAARDRAGSPPPAPESGDRGRRRDATPPFCPRHPARRRRVPWALRLRPQRLARLRLPVPLQLSCCPECNGIALLL